MASDAGRRLGRFEILSLLGRGGMGEVYRARDTRLGRDVALKLLPEAVAGDRQAIARFEQEARSASALNHPNIVTIFDVGEEARRPFIVTELLEGETLRQRLAADRLRIDEAVDVVANAAAGLAAAHAAGIIHRDVKPENIFLTGKRRQVKLLDFGIARLAADAVPLAQAETGAAATSVGSLIGTPAYMSPEQARGEAIDRRSDIFSLGCVLHELVSGASPFERQTAIETIAAIVTEPPPPIAPALHVPAAVSRVIDRALAKDPVERFQSIDDFAFALRNAAESQVVADAPRRPRSRVWPWIAASAAAGAAVAGFLVGQGRRDVSPAFALRASTVVPSSVKPTSPVLSPDGKWVAYISLAGSEADVFVQPLNGSTAVNITRPHNVEVQRRTIVGRLDVPPDGSHIVVPGPARFGVFQVPGIWTVPAPFGGPPQRVTDKYASLAISSDGKRIAGVLANPTEGDGIAIADADGSNERILIPMVPGVHLHQLAWGHDDRYVYYQATLAPTRHGDIFRMPAAGGSAEPVVRTAGMAMFPAPTPDGQAIVYAGNHSGEGLNLWWHPLDNSPPRRLTIGSGEYTEPFVSRNGTSLVALARRRRVSLIRVSADATDGVSEPLVGTAPGDTQPTIARRSGHLFVTSTRSGDSRIWSIRAPDQGAVPLTTEGAADADPAVSPDGSKVAFISSRGGRRGIWLVSAAGSPPRLIALADIIDPLSWAPDSRRVIYAVAGGNRPEVWIADVDSGQTHRLDNVHGRVPAWAPDGDLIAVVRATNNAATLYFVTPRGDEVRGSIPIAPIGHPLVMAWSPDGRRLALVNLPGRGQAEAWVVDVQTAKLWRVVNLPSPSDIDGLAWTSDGRHLVLGRIDFEDEVVLIEGLPKK